MLSVCLWIPHITFWMPEPIFMKLGTYITEPEPISTAYFMNPSHQPVYTPIVARQRLGRSVTAATNTHATIDEFLDASFFMRSMSYRRISKRLVLPRSSFIYWWCILIWRIPFLKYNSSFFITIKRICQNYSKPSLPYFIISIFIFPMLLFLYF
jgi:hypothetical protein